MSGSTKNWVLVFFTGESQTTGEQTEGCVKTRQAGLRGKP